MPLVLSAVCLLAACALGEALYELDCTAPPEVSEICCHMPTLNKNPIMDMAANECVAAMNESNSQDDIDYDCLEECIYKKSGLLTANNKLDIDKIRKYITFEVDNNGSWGNLFINTLGACIDKAPKMVGDATNCRSGSGHFTMCLVKEMLMNCPDQNWVSGGNCTELRRFMKDCNNAEEFFSRKK